MHVKTQSLKKGKYYKIEATNKKNTGYSLLHNNIQYYMIKYAKKYNPVY